MEQYDKYQLFLRLTNKKDTTSNYEALNSSCKKQHPTVLSGKRNPNNEAYKKLHQSSEIFKENTTPIKSEITRPKNYATERKSREDSNTKRTLIPSLDKFQSPEKRCSSNIRYNANNESSQKDSKRILKTCEQRQQDFSHRINLPISAMQVKDYKEDNYGLGKYKSHESTQKLKSYLDLQGHMNNQSFQSQTDRLFKTQVKNQKNLLSSYQICKTQSEIKNGKKRFIQSAMSQQLSPPIVPIKPKDINKIFLKSSKEVWENQQSKAKAIVKMNHANQQKSQIDLR
ncbi:unnamed protein product (macronuclear) [Paramecium tetraurelia]|uniref:Uncharacterized protein n=1 Tax=Paramecium tetraurelia TaxID=5888 RepID=A0BSU2_PARTE|nr:uncharacterized protein GSPATT00031841001 [Paramecium tetraurelia]CAK61609.1 unnamed protein product [Paramecium tetraurelia]|eukprot:XP_001429007.1 hypothetical protein (macronuclear) [Paramecium tetraurelia strain d4-2]